jgi:DNA-binding IclR family transcriptional regulator
LIDEPARAAMLLQLMDGRAMTTRELASAAGISPATGSRQLAMMVEAELPQVTAVGRHRYHRIGSQQVAGLLESIMQVAGAAAQTGRVCSRRPEG